MTLAEALRLDNLLATLDLAEPALVFDLFQNLWHGVRCRKDTTRHEQGLGTNPKRWRALSVGVMLLLRSRGLVDCLPPLFCLSFYFSCVACCSFCSRGSAFFSVCAAFVCVCVCTERTWRERSKVLCFLSVWRAPLTLSRLALPLASHPFPCRCWFPFHRSNQTDSVFSFSLSLFTLCLPLSVSLSLLCVSEKEYVENVKPRSNLPTERSVLSASLPEREFVLFCRCFYCLVAQRSTRQTVAVHLLIASCSFACCVCVFFSRVQSVLSLALLPSVDNKTTNHEFCVVSILFSSRCSRCLFLVFGSFFALFFLLLLVVFCGLSRCWVVSFSLVCCLVEAMCSRSNSPRIEKFGIDSTVF